MASGFNFVWYNQTGYDNFEPKNGTFMARGRGLPAGISGRKVPVPDSRFRTATGGDRHPRELGKRRRRQMDGELDAEKYF